MVVIVSGWAGCRAVLPFHGSIDSQSAPVAINTQPWWVHIRYSVLRTAAPLSSRVRDGCMCTLLRTVRIERECGEGQCVVRVDSVQR